MVQNLGGLELRPLPRPNPRHPDSGGLAPADREDVGLLRPADVARRLSPGERPGTTRVPFQQGDRAAYLAAVKQHGSIAARTHGAPLALVNLRDLVAIQETINDERLAQHSLDPNLIPPGKRGAGHGGLEDKPIVVRMGGVMYVHNGHHRLTAAWIRGQETAKVRFIDLDAEAQQP